MAMFGMAALVGPAVESPVMPTAYAASSAMSIVPGSGSTPLYGQYPNVGGSDGGRVYWDETSCYSATDGNIATLGCIIFLTSDDGYPGYPGKVRPITVKFKTFKKSGQRHVLLDSAVENNGKDYTDYFLNYDEGFLKSLFWKIAKHTGIASDLD